ncbi:hypothetical protein P3T37_007129 [Kitasatospora sp. MAA4]|uniref:hypothetical protein n=1 Tax=Kitasatospora sp. MAA4 TaxID=3035093 RepID=UPI0024745CEB|nr:hypothetical protein [Kitasatospora sp. MAA4]MDH6137696.1 hypothetical protein [Kitasatospora sp. MAA4]
MSSQPSRRRVLTVGLGLAGGVGLWSAAVTAAGAATTLTGWAGDTSANGWPVIAQAAARPVEGAGAVSVAVLDGDAATVLLHVARRFHYDVQPLAPDEITGHRTDRALAVPYESNYLSGTAIAVHPLLYPVHASGGFFPPELTVIRDILADLEGVVRWGGDESVPKESHFQLDVPPGDPGLKRVAAKVRQWNSQPGEGAGAIDPLAPGRLQAARSLAQRQR